jgi:hypothetical protein
MSYGTNLDTLYVVGWLDLSKGPQVLHVPAMNGRYYSVQFTDPSKNTTLPMSANALQGRRRATTSSRGRAGKDRHRTA